ncbi:unnamed protein product [Arctia plantaginis]|uniref:Uncharacterized protein n=1 Tax=Arctia plantaginis TaxID=874455 RepID=A0A8S1A101_ARCPL|nr:unnamed protein product [Arctia plantaginis]
MILKALVDWVVRLTKGKPPGRRGGGAHCAKCSAPRAQWAGGARACQCLTSRGIDGASPAPAPAPATASAQPTLAFL